MTPFLGLINWLKHFTELRKTVYLVEYWFITKDIIKDTNEPLGEEVHRVKSRRVPSSGASIPVDLGCTVLLAREGTTPEAHQVCCSRVFLQLISSSAPQW